MRAADVLRAIVLLLALVVAQETSRAARAEEVVPKSRMQALAKFIWLETGQGALSRSQRVEFAQLIGSVCDDYRNFVPTPTPDEQAWLNAELTAGGKRMEAAAASAINARNVAAITFDQCATLTDVLAREQEGGSLHNWIPLAIVLNDHDLFDTFSRFGLNGAGNSDIGAVNVIFRSIVRTVLLRVVGPQLK